ncbi:MAG: terminase small subunit [Pseudomonadota bacterium]|nr:terminase small subunit [Pseudomonadota bacterium]
MALNGRGYAFARAFAKCENVREAALKAGYSLRTADVQGARLLRDEQVAAQIAKFKEQQRQAAEAKMFAGFSGIGAESCFETENGCGEARDRATTVRDKAVLSLEKTMAKLQEIVDVSLETGKPSAAVSAVMAMAKLAGLTDKSEENGGVKITIKKYDWENDDGHEEEFGNFDS